jgi:hypothetical protein
MWKGEDINVCVEPEYAAGAQIVPNEENVQDMLAETDTVQPSIPSFVRRSMRARKPTYKCREGSPSEVSAAFLSLHPFGVPDEDKENDARNRMRKNKQLFIEQPEYYREPDASNDGNGIGRIVFCFRRSCISYQNLQCHRRWSMCYLLQAMQSRHQ